MAAKVRKRPRFTTSQSLKAQELFCAWWCLGLCHTTAAGLQSIPVGVFILWKTLRFRGNELQGIVLWKEQEKSHGGPSKLSSYLIALDSQHILQLFLKITSKKGREMSQQRPLRACLAQVSVDIVWSRNKGFRVIRVPRKKISNYIQRHSYKFHLELWNWNMIEIVVVTFQSLASPHIQLPQTSRVIRQGKEEGKERRGR